MSFPLPHLLVFGKFTPNILNWNVHFCRKWRPASIFVGKYTWCLRSYYASVNVLRQRPHLTLGNWENLLKHAPARGLGVKRFFHARKGGGRWNFFTGKNGRGMILQCTAKTFFRPVKKLVKLIDFPINFAHSLIISCKIIIFPNLFHYDACYELNHVFLFYSQNMTPFSYFSTNQIRYTQLWAPWQNFLAILNVKVLKHA